MKIGNQVFEIGKQTYVMGILNVTPDSFSDGGKWSQLDHAMLRTEQMIKQGAAIIDVGGESTRPGYTKISDQEEIERIAPVIEKIKSTFDIPVSLDTYKSNVASAGILAGADLINDIWGLQYDENMAKVISDNKVACCLMHNRKEAVYHDFMKDIISDFSEMIRIAELHHIDEEKIMLDPGVGFAKSYEQNLEIINKIEELHMFGYPVLLGTSRKSVIGLTLDLPIEERLEGTIATTVIGTMKGCSFIRVHDVLENVRAIKMTRAIIQS